MSDLETLIKINTPESTELVKPLTEISAGDLTPGTRLSGLPGFSDLDAFLERAVVILGNQNQRAENPQVFFFRSERIDSVGDKLLEQVRAKRFYGVLRNFSIVMLLPEMIPNVPNVRKNISKNESLAFILDAEMHSTGRGRIGNARRLCGLYITQAEPIKVVTPDAPTPYIAREIIATSRLFEPLGFQSDVDRLLQDSKRGERIRTLEALSQTVLVTFGGGKRR
jgi:hypothetical protein